MKNMTTSLVGIGLASLAVASGVFAGSSFFGFSSEGRTGGDLTNAEKGTVQSAINLIEATGDSVAAAALRTMLAEGAINREDNPDVTGTGNSSLKSENDPDNPDKAMNISPKTLNPALEAKSGALADLAGVLIHEYVHLFDMNENEMWSRVGQANVLCAIACIGLEGGITTKDKEAICKEYDSVVFWGSQASILAEAGYSLEDYLDLVDCPCCDGSSGIIAGSQAPPDPGVVAAMASVPMNWSPGGGTYSPSSDTVRWPDYSFRGTESPELRVDYYKPSDGSRTTFVVPLSFFPTAIDGDELGNVYVGGKDATGKSVITRFVFSYSGDSVTVSSPSTILASSKISVVSQITHVDYGGMNRLYALDGAGGRFGFLDIATGELTTMASSNADPQMSGWKSFVLKYDAPSGGVLIELSSDFPMIGFYRSGEYLYVLYDDDNDGQVDSTLYDLVENIAFPD